MALNVWALDKDQSIKQVLIRLQSHLGKNEFIIEDSSQLDNRAVFLQHRNDPEYRVYLYTLGQAENRYAIHLEYPGSMSNVKTIDAYENLSLRALVDILAVHFDIAEIQELNSF